MGKILVAIALFCCLTVGSGRARSEELAPFAPITPPIPVDAVRVVAGPERIEALADLRDGRPAVINFWATWCAPCVAELPTLDGLADALGGAVIVILANGDRGPIARPAAFLDRLGIVRPVRAYDSAGLLAGAVSVRQWPTTVLVDQDGMAVARFEGAADWSAPETVAMIQEFLATVEDTD